MRCFGCCASARAPRKYRDRRSPAVSGYWRSLPAVAAAACAATTRGVGDAVAHDRARRVLLTGQALQLTALRGLASIGALIPEAETALIHVGPALVALADRPAAFRESGRRNGHCGQNQNKALHDISP